LLLLLVIRPGVAATDCLAFRLGVCAPTSWPSPAATISLSDVGFSAATSAYEPAAEGSPAGISDFLAMRDDFRGVTGVELEVDAEVELAALASPDFLCAAE